MKTGLPRLLALGIALGLLATVACSPSVVGPEGESWRLVSYGDAAAPETPPADRTATAEFEDGKVTGSAGCNSYYSSYETSGSQLTIGPVAATEMYCPDAEAVMDLEREFLSAIGTVETFVVEGGELRMSYPGGVLTFTAR